MNTKLAAILPALQRAMGQLARELFGSSCPEGEIVTRLAGDAITIAIIVRQGSIKLRRDRACRYVEATLDREGYVYDRGPLDREIAFYVHGMLAAPLTVDEVIERNRTRKRVDLPTAAPSAKSRDTEARAAWAAEQTAEERRIEMEHAAAKWARDLDPSKRSGVRRTLCDRIANGDRVEMSAIHLAALDAVIAEERRWVETEERGPSSDVRRVA